LINQFDFIIVGQGLAGTTLAHIFLQRGQKVLVIDEPRPITSSKVAAGVWNPVVFKRYTQSYLAPTLLAFNTVFFPQVEKLTGTTFYHPRPYYKVFSSADDVQHWQGKQHNPDVEEFLNPSINNQLNTAYNAPHGAALINQCGNVDVNVYLQASANYFASLGGYLPQKFDYGAFETTEEGIKYKRYTAKKVIFCEGLGTLQNPWWATIPFVPAKGEVLEIKAQLPDEQSIISKNIFIVPLGNDTYRVGSTYRWSDLENTTTEAAKAELIGKLEKLITVPYEIISHKAAVRPAIIDRRPVLGLHPANDKIGVFNGLGSRGIMLSPYFANHFADYLLDGKELDREVDVQRFNI
jgi:glycine oxidase